MVWILCLPLFAFVIYQLSTNGEQFAQAYYAFNQPLFQFINGLPLGPEWLWQCITFMGDGLPVFVVLVFFSRKNAQVLWIGLIAALITGLGVQLGKPIFDVLRPAAVLADDQLHVIGQTLKRHAFPSGHSATAFVLAGVLMNFMPRSFKWPLLIAASLIAWSRVKVGAHWPVDVMVGSLLGWYSAKAAFWVAARSRWMETPGTAIKRRGEIALYSLATICALVLWGHNGGYPQASALGHALSLMACAFMLVIFIERVVGKELHLLPRPLRMKLETV
jgi:membrane-associated phospholipid phosphatase